MKSVLIIGMGRFGRHMAQKLYDLGHDVLAIDKNEEKINKVLSYVTNAQIGDSTDESFIDSLGVSNFDLCVVAIGDDFQSSLETTALLKDYGSNLLSLEPCAMYTLNSYCAMEPMKLYILKNKLVTGPPYVFQAKTSLTTYNLLQNIPFMKLPHQPLGLEKPC